VVGGCLFFGLRRVCTVRVFCILPAAEQDYIAALIKFYESANLSPCNLPTILILHHDEYTICYNLLFRRKQRYDKHDSGDRWLRTGRQCDKSPSLKRTRTKTKAMFSFPPEMVICEAGATAMQSLRSISQRKSSTWLQRLEVCSRT